MHKTRRWFGVVAILSVAAAAACSSSSNSGGPATTDDAGAGVAEATIGATGGNLSSTDGVLTVSIPSGALDANTVIRVEEIPAPVPGAIGKTYEIGPTGTQFKSPVTLSFKYGGVDLQGNTATDLEVATVVDNAWSPLVGDTVDTSAEVASGTTMHLSPYGIVARAHDGGNPHDSATGSDSASSNDTGATQDTGSSNDGGASSDASTSDGASFDAHDSSASDGGSVTDTGVTCSPEFSNVGSCANHPAFCTSYPGTQPGACTTNDGGQGYVVMCCTPDGG